MTPTLTIMVKEPVPGRVKTRLAREIGTVQAAWWMRHQTARLIRRLRDPRWRLELAVAPDTALGSAAWPAVPRRAQGAGDLGARMRRILARPGPQIVIGADIPDLYPIYIGSILPDLARRDLVFGPAEDGGYWLIGVGASPALPPDFLRGVRWSTPHALADSCATWPDARIGWGQRLADVDTRADLRRPDIRGPDLRRLG